MPPRRLSSKFKTVKLLLSSASSTTAANAQLSAAASSSSTRTAEQQQQQQQQTQQQTQQGAQAGELQHEPEGTVPPLVKFVEMADFVPAPGALYEVPLCRGDHVELVDDTTAPPGWIYVHLPAAGVTGLVPESFLEQERGVGGGAQPASAAADRAAEGDAVDDPDGNAAAAAAYIAAAGDEREGDGDAPSDEARSEQGSPARKYTQEELEKAAEEAYIRKTSRSAIAAFKPDPGSVYELPMNAGDIVRLATVNWNVPPGWVAVRHENAADAYASASGEGLCVATMELELGTVAAAAAGH